MEQGINLFEALQIPFLEELRNNVAFDDKMLKEYHNGDIDKEEYYCSLIYRIPYKHGMKVVWTDIDINRETKQCHYK